MAPACPGIAPTVEQCPDKGPGARGQPQLPAPNYVGCPGAAQQTPSVGRSHMAAAGDPVVRAPALGGQCGDPARGWRGMEGVPFVLGTKPRSAASSEPARCRLCTPRHRAHAGTTHTPPRPRPGNNRDATGRKVQGGWHRARDGVKGWGWRRSAAGSARPLGGAATHGQGTAASCVAWAGGAEGRRHGGGDTAPRDCRGGLGTALAAVNH